MKFILAGAQKGRELINRTDEYISRLSHVELSMRLDRFSACADEYAQSLGGCVLEWEEQDIKKLRPVLENAEKIISGLGMLLDDVYLVKTDGSDEYCSAYTRGSTIYLPPNKIAYEPEKLTKLILHEFFHVFFRNRKGMQKELYKLAGFELTDEIELPESLKDRKLTNPDGPVLNYCTEINFEGRSAFVCPVTMLKEGLSRIDPEQDIMESIEFGLLEIEKSGGVWRPVILNGGPSVICADDERLELGGPDADILDPNEILAEAFVELALVVGGKNLIEYDSFREIIKSPV